MIPKVVHACWFGGGQQSGLIKDCMASWNEKLSGYEIRIWTEADIGIDEPYFDALLKRKKWAFASDFARFWLLYRYGGIWLDTDVEVIRSFDHLLDHSFFTGYESGELIGGCVMGSVPGHPLSAAVLSALLEAFERRDAPENIPAVITRARQSCPAEDVTILPSDRFYPFNPYAANATRGQLLFRDVSESTIAIHHWAATWTAAERTLLERIRRRFGGYWTSA